MRILHIEDIEVITDLVRKVCGDSFLIDRAPTLKSARMALSCQSYDLLLVDLNLPDSCELDTVKELISYNLPIIVLASSPSQEFVEAAAFLGVSDYIAKEKMIEANIPLRIRFALRKHQKIEKRKPSLSFRGLADLKPYLSCGTLVSH